MLYRLPNLLTLSRIFIIPALVGTFYLKGPLGHWLGLVVFVYAGITDFFDGYVARAQNLQSRLGQFLDPVADKLLVASAIVMMIAFDRISGFSVLAALVILCREIMVSGLREFLAEIKVSLPVTRLAKWKTTVQVVALSFLLVGDALPAWIPIEEIGITSLWVAAILTLYTGYDYLRVGLKHMTA